MARQRILSFGTAIFGLALLAWFFTFKVVDSDFWWHVKAGELIWNSKSMIRTDPFAYTREGLPYLARHEWLAQVLLYMFFTVGGPLGIIILRVVAAATTFGILLTVDRRNFWPYAFLCVAAALVMRQGFIERPQLLSNILFAFMLERCFALLRLLGDGDAQATRKRRNAIIVGMCFTQVLWVNLHGAAALLSVGMLGTVALQAHIKREGGFGASKPFFATCLLLLAAMLISPNGILNFTYVWDLFTDSTAAFIEEWSPHPWPQYLTQLGPFWVLAIGSLLSVRRAPVAVGLLLITFGIFSRMASRHEALFIITALGCMFFELQHCARWQNFLARIREKSLLVCGVTALAIAMVVFVNRPYVAFLRMKNFLGVGTFEPAHGGYEFLADHGIAQPTFNTYRIGGYLLYRGAKVFLDGRNVDYGYDFLSKALMARYDSLVWEELVAQYGFTAAIIEPASSEGLTTTFEFRYLTGHPDWALVYLDDWTAVYLKRMPGNAQVITENAYTLLHPEKVLAGNPSLDDLPSQFGVLEAELRRMALQDEQGVAALLALAKLTRGQGRFFESLSFLHEAQRRFPYRYESYELEASIAEAQGRWPEAAKLYSKVIDLTEFLPVTLHFAHLVEVAERAGDFPLAEWAKRRIK